MEARGLREVSMKATGGSPELSGMARLQAYLRLLRPSDWTKNVLVLAPLVFARRLANPAADWRAVAAFVAFVLISSGFYCVNDALDVNEDRLHPVKRLRPVAAGQIAPRAAAAFGLVLIVAGTCGGFALRRLLGLDCLFYVALQVAYNLRLKRVLMVDVTAVASGFVLRAAAGSAAIAVRLSVWMALCVFFLTLYLGFIKRLCDLSTAERAADEAGLPATGGWHSVAGYDSRAELNWLLGLTAALTIVTYIMYTLSERTEQNFYPRHSVGIAFAMLTPLVVIAIHRFFRRASLGWSDRPMDAILGDRAVRACIFLFAAGVLLALYAPHLDDWVQRLFMK